MRDIIVENPINAIRGMNDILPHESILWQTVENIIHQTSQSFGYTEIRLPIVEKTELFKRTIGEVTDIVEKEMYTFEDRHGEMLSLRPEGTAGCVRAGIEHGLFYNQVQRLWYQGPYFRYERPQKGRYRQFYQFGAEAFGLQGPDIDAEIILLSAMILEKLGLKPSIELQINSLGSVASRAVYREKLVQYLKAHHSQLDEDSQRRLLSNPLRILDSKNPAMQSLLQNAPLMSDYLDDESKIHFDKLKQLLDVLGLKFTHNPYLVRGLDYYTKTVFEWVTKDLGAQGTVCAGGRYDGLIEQLGGKPTPALGFAMGLERLILLVQQLQPELGQKNTDVYFITDNDAAFARGLLLSHQLRGQFPSITLLMNCGGGSIKNQFKKADKSGAKIALILGEQELQNGTVAVKYLRENHPQATIPEEQLKEYLKNVIF